MKAKSENLTKTVQLKDQIKAFQNYFFTFKITFTFFTFKVTILFR